MLLSLALILLSAITLSEIMLRLKLPPQLGMMIAGVIIGPYALNLITGHILDISAEIRQIALVIILLKAGLALDIKALQKVGLPAILMCFVPASLEIIAVVIFAPLIFGISYLEAAIMGSVLAAVSPAIVVPRMLKLIEQGYGIKSSVPLLVMAGASLDDIFVIILFTSFTNLFQGGSFNLTELICLPIFILLMIALGILTGTVIAWFLRKCKLNDIIKVLLLLCISFLFISLENALKDILPLSGLLAVMSLGATIYKQEKDLAGNLSAKFTKLWIGAEMFLFVLVGAAIDISYIKSTAHYAILLILLALVFRIIGVMLCLLKAKLSKNEKLFTAIAYLPKATVQAAIGGIPLALGIPSGHLILMVAVVSIIITAPIGAIGIDTTYKNLLKKD